MLICFACSLAHFREPASESVGERKLPSESVDISSIRTALVRREIVSSSSSAPSVDDSEQEVIDNGLACEE